MITSRVYSFLASTIALALCACGSDSTSPPVNTQASHYDSLSRAALASGDISRGGALSMVALAYMGGVSPASVSVEDSNATTTYEAIVVRELLSGAPPFPGADSLFEVVTVVLWQPPDGTRFISVVGSTDSVAFGTTDTSFVHFGELDWGNAAQHKISIDGYALIATSDSSGSCPLASSTLRCTRATFTVSLDAVLKPTVGSTRLPDYTGASHPISATALLVPGIITEHR
jgi:hypothetical protein